MTAVAEGSRRPSIDAFAAGTMVVLCLCWGLNQIAVKIVNQGLQPVFQAGLRSLFAALIVYAWCRYRNIPLFARDGTLIPGIVAGVLFGVEFIFIYVGIDYTSVARGIVCVYTAPFIVAAGAHFLIPGERLTLMKVVGLLAAFAGVLLIFSDELSLPTSNAIIGDMLCLAAGFAWGATTLCVRVTRLAEVSAEKTLLYQLVVSAVLMLVIAPFYGPLVREVTALVTGAMLFQIVVVGAFSYVTWFWMLRHYQASQLAAFTFLTPVFAVVLGNLLLDEPVSMRLIAALALVAAGIAIVSRKSA
jgi:drug/metabolite transporter (DMT)-like permease